VAPDSWRTKAALIVGYAFCHVTNWASKLSFKRWHFLSEVDNRAVRGWLSLSSSSSDE
jgi:hypothetical protein